MNELSELEKNVKNVWGQQGRAWLNQLPKIIELLSAHWLLTGIEVAKNMSYNYVALANQSDKKAVVLKISCDKKLIVDEYKALKHFSGIGAVNVLDMDEEYNALLLEQAVPGYLLKENHPTNGDPASLSR